LCEFRRSGNGLQRIGWRAVVSIVAMRGNMKLPRDCGRGKERQNEGGLHAPSDSSHCLSCSVPFDTKSSPAFFCIAQAFIRIYEGVREALEKMLPNTMRTMAQRLAALDGDLALTARRFHSVSSTMCLPHYVSAHAESRRLRRRSFRERRTSLAENLRPGAPALSSKDASGARVPARGDSEPLLRVVGNLPEIRGSVAQSE
jgi:hypothetical protein